MQDQLVDLRLDLRDETSTKRHIGLMGDMLSEYNSLEKHIAFSTKLYTINQKGKNILLEISKKKPIRIKRSGEPEYNSQTMQIVQALQDTLNYRKFCFRLFFNLQYYLDELMFKQVNNLKTFFIEDGEYELTKLYCSSVNNFKSKSLVNFSKSATAFWSIA